MSLLMMLALGARKRIPQAHTLTFTASTTWTPPVGIAKVDSMTGHGGQGANNTYTYKVKARYTERTYNESINYQGAHSTYTLGNYGPYDGETPGNFCDPWSTIQNSTITQSRICYEFTDASIYGTGGSITTGPSATAFGKVFPGSYGPSTPANVAFADVTVTAGVPYQITVPAGGSITINWTEYV